MNDLANEVHTHEEIEKTLFELEGPKPQSKAKDASLLYIASICFIVLGIAIGTHTNTTG